MNCPRCSKALEPRTSQGLVAFACQDHGAWQDWATIRELARRASLEADPSAALLEGFIWGRII